MLSVLDREDMFVANIDIPERLRQMDIDRVEKIAESMAEIGLQTPITVRMINDGESVILVAGRHRLEAAARLGWDKISVVFVEGEDDDFRLWEIAENLHRSELTPLERSEHIAEWIRLTEKNQVGQVAQPEKLVGYKEPPAQKKSGISEASRKIGVERTEARRAVKIDSISPEAKQACRDAGLDRNQSALLKVASAPANGQVAAVAEAAKRPIKGPSSKPDEEAAAAIALLRQGLGSDYDAFLGLIRPLGAQRFWSALMGVGL